MPKNNWIHKLKKNTWKPKNNLEENKNFEALKKSTESTERWNLCGK